MRAYGSSQPGAKGSTGSAATCSTPTSVGACIAEVNPELVVNMAGAASVAASWERPGEDFAINATGVLNLLEAVSRNAPDAHVVCASSAEVYGEPHEGSLPFTEDRGLEPLTPYGAAKASMEALCGQYARGRGLRIAVIRAFSQIGPGQSPAFAASGFARQIALAEAAGGSGLSWPSATSPPLATSPTSATPPAPLSK